MEKQIRNLKLFNIISYLNILIIILICFIPLLSWYFYLRSIFYSSDSIPLSGLVQSLLIPPFIVSVILSSLALYLYFRLPPPSFFIISKLSIFGILNAALIINYITMVLVKVSCERYFQPVTDGFTVCRGWPIPIPQRLEMGLFFLSNTLFWSFILWLSAFIYNKFKIRKLG